MGLQGRGEAGGLEDIHNLVVVVDRVGSPAIRAGSLVEVDSLGVVVGSQVMVDILDSLAGTAVAGRLDVADNCAQVVDMPGADTDLVRREGCLGHFEAGVGSWLAQDIG